MTPRKAPGFVTGVCLGVQSGLDVETVSENAKILSQIMSQVFLLSPLNSPFINQLIT
jgi:hypothetical protein